jgi:uncharacterized protein (TIGR00725 family)
MADDHVLDGDDPARQEGSRSQDSATDLDPSYNPDADPTIRAIGVMGSSGGELLPDTRLQAFELGRAIAEAGCTIITGACPGLPYDAARGAQAAGGLSVGISPALSRSEHVKRYQSPVDAYDAIIYTGSGLMGREVHNIHSSDIIVIITGRSGTLGEFSIAFDEGKLIGVVQGSGGIADALPELMPQLGKNTGARVIFDRDPQRLVHRLIEEYRTTHYRHPSKLVDLAPTEDGQWPASASSAPRAS